MCTTIHLSFFKDRLRFCKWLELFYFMNVLFFWFKVIQSSMFSLKKFVKLGWNFLKWLNSDIEEIQVMTSIMIFMFKKYYNVIYGVLAITTILDSRFNMRLIHFYFPQLYGSHHMLKLNLYPYMDLIICCDLMKFYKFKIKYSRRILAFYILSSSTSKWDGSSSSTSLANRKDGYLKFKKFVNNVENNVDNVKSKLDYYLDESLLLWTKDFNILQWWKLNGIEYPFLCEIVKDVLVVSISTVGFASGFN